jgi:hypothetical protein
VSSRVASVFFDVIANGPCPNEGHPRWIAFIHCCEKCIYDSHFFGAAESPQVDSQEESRHQPKVREPRVDHDIGKDWFAVSFILREQAPDIIQILHSPLRQVTRRTALSLCDAFMASFLSGVP